MPAALRDFPYIWTTWLPRLLTGENSCEWAVWFKSRYGGWDRASSDFDQSRWLMDHTTLLSRLAPTACRPSTTPPKPANQTNLSNAVRKLLVWCIRSSLGNKGPTYADLLLCFKHECVFLSFWKASE